MTLEQRHAEAAEQSKKVTTILWLLLARETPYFSQPYARVLAQQEFDYPKEFALAEKLHAKLMLKTYPKFPKRQRRRKNDR